MNASQLTPQRNFKFVHCYLESFEVKLQEMLQDISLLSVDMAVYFGQKQAILS